MVVIPKLDIKIKLNDYSFCNLLKPIPLSDAESKINGMWF